MTYNVWKLLLSATLLVGASFAFADDDAVPLKVVVFGGHPDDPESACGGLIATLTAAGHEVHAGLVSVGKPESGLRKRRSASRAAT